MSTTRIFAQGDCGKATGTVSDGGETLANSRGVHVVVPKETAPAVRIEDGAGHLSFVRELIGEYVAWLGRDLAFQGIEEELAHLENKYLPPRQGALRGVLSKSHVVGHGVHEKNALKDTLGRFPMARPADI